MGTGVDRRVAGGALGATHLSGCTARRHGGAARVGNRNVGIDHDKWVCVVTPLGEVLVYRGQRRLPFLMWFIFLRSCMNNMKHKQHRARFSYKNKPYLLDNLFVIVIVEHAGCVVPRVECFY